MQSDCYIRQKQIRCREYFMAVTNQPYDLFKFGVPKTQDDEFMKTCQQEPMNFDSIKSINDCVASKLDDVWKNYFYNGSIWIDTDGMLPRETSGNAGYLGRQLE